MYKLFFVSIFVCLAGCQKFVEIDSPVTKYDAKKIYQRDETAIAVITGIYQNISGDGAYQGAYGFSSIFGLSADELIEYNFDDNRMAVYRNQINPNNVFLWDQLYPHIYTVNTAIEGISGSTTISPNIKDILIGEAKFLRAFFYFEAVNIWGDIPLLTNNDFEKNSSAARTSAHLVYQQVVQDLLDAQNLLTTNYLLSDLKTTTDKRIRPNKWTAKALLAKVYLYMKEYAKAEALANEIISQTDLFILEPLSKVFLNESKEAIWQIQPVNALWNTHDGKTFVLNSEPTFQQPFSLSKTLIEDFENGDNRLPEWVGSIKASATEYYYPNKYKAAIENGPQQESLLVFRLAEQYLIRAEARLGLSRISDSVADLNKIRGRARAAVTVSIPNPLPPIQNTIGSNDLLEAIIHERRIELFTEWGNRWFDLKRLGRIDQVMMIMTPQKGGGAWESYKAFFPIPSTERERNRNLTQNQGYN